MAQSKPVVASNEHRELKFRIRQLAILHEIARAVTSVLDLQSVLNRIVDAAVYLTQAEEGFLMLVDGESQELHLRAGRGLGDKAAKVMRVPVDDSLSGQVMRTGKPLRMAGRTDSDLYKVKTGYLVKSILKVPINGPERILWVLPVDHAIESYKIFSDQDLSLLASLAEYAAIAIENARRYAEATRRADELSKTLAEVGDIPKTPSRDVRDADREALQEFNEALRSQREEVSKVQQNTQALAQELQAKATAAGEIAQQLETWYEQAGNLLPQLDRITHTAMVSQPSSPLPETSAEVLSVIDILLENLPDGILLCNARGKIVQIGASATKILGMTREEILDKKLQGLFPDDAHWEHLIGSLRLAFVLGDKKTLPPPNSGATFYQDDKVIQTKIFPLNTQHNQGIAIIVIIRDISLETEGWRVRDETVNTLSESLRTPLAAVHSYGDMLLSESVGLITSAQRSYLQRIRDGVDQMEGILVRFINARKDEVSITQTKQGLPVAALNEAIDAAREELTLAGVQLVVDIDATLPPVQISPEFFTRVMTDLLIKAGAHIQTGEKMVLTTDIQSGENQPSYLVVGIGNQTSRPGIKQHLKDDPDLKTIAKAVQYQGGRIWIEISYQGQWTISFLLPVAT